MTERQRHERASLLFLELRGLPRDETERRLALATDGDLLLAREVQSLLEHDVDGATRDDGEPLAVGAPLDAPARIGPYTILRRIGHGGSAFVLLGEQQEPVRRRVAIKIVPHAAVDPDFAARFEFERRALERTDHPNIARILDTGRTADGLPYLVMDYIEGMPITESCRSNSLGLRERIALLLDVADAVQHAHQRGVIHRDLKPANILVSEVNGRLTPRVLDFGIAKPIPETFGDDSPPTSGLPLGTPSYMAPEQTGGQAIDTRADVYALGAVLYELACGQPPIDARCDPLEALRRIRETVPPPPSRLLAQGEAPLAAPRSLLADLDCIVQKALEKDPVRRYATVGALADDLRRLLRREPIEARAPTLRYRAARFAQRNRRLVVALAVVSLAVILGIAGLTKGLVESRRRQRETNDKNEELSAINAFLRADLLGAAAPDQQPHDVTALELLDRASKKVDQQFADRPLTAAAIHHALGEAYAQLGAYEVAEHHLERAVLLHRSVGGIDAPDTIRSEIAAASLLARREKLPEAEAALVSVIDRARLILGADDPDLYSALNDLGLVYEGRDRGRQAVGALVEALEGRSRLLGPRDPRVLVTTSNLAQAYDRVGDTARSLELQLGALRFAEAIPDPPRMVLLGLYNNIGATYQDLNREREAEPYLRRAVELASEWLGPDSDDTLTIKANLASLEAKLGDPLEGAAVYETLIEARTRQLGPDALGTLTARYGYWDCLWLAREFDEAAEGYAELLPDLVRALGETHWLAIQTRASLARALRDGGHPDRALTYAKQAAEQFEALYGPSHARTINAVELFKELSAAQAKTGD